MVRFHSNFQIIFNCTSSVEVTCLPKLNNRGKYKQPINPWVTKGILTSIRKRNKLYKLSLNHPTPSHIRSYRKYRNKLTSTIRLSKKLYFSNKLKNAEGKMLKVIYHLRFFWNVHGINELLNKKSRTLTQQTFNINGHKVDEPDEIANLFNEYFVNIGPDQASKIDRHNHDFKEFLPESSYPSLFLYPTDFIEILNIVRSLKSSHSYSHDEVSTHLLKKIIGSILSPLVHIFNLSLSSGVVPASFKTAKVIPIYKKDDPSSMSNYRPISILPSFSKILERIVYNRLYKFLTQNDSLNPDQFGFRKFHSTDLALLQLFDRVSNALADHKHVIGIFMDLSKAFDTLDHTILLYKLKHYGVRGKALDWFENYLSSRKQYTLFNSVSSNVSSIKCGVPQGSILGPLLFLIYVNDISNVSPILQYILFADDTNVFYSHSDLNLLIATMNIELPKLSKWFKSNILSLNLKKTNFIHFRNSRNHNIYNFELLVDNVPIEKKSSTKFLGVYMNEKCNWNDHVNFSQYWYTI